MYIEADNRNPSDNAYMQTRWNYVNDGTARCLTFWQVDLIYIILNTY